MRISDWSSDVCSSDLRRLVRRPTGIIRVALVPVFGIADRRLHVLLLIHRHEDRLPRLQLVEGRMQMVHTQHSLAAERIEAGDLDALRLLQDRQQIDRRLLVIIDFATDEGRSEEHTSELQSLMRISYA